MENIYILTVSNEENSGDWYFSTQEKAQKFIDDNFAFDKPRRLTDELYQGRHHNYVIDSQAIDQARCF